MSYVPHPGRYDGMMRTGVPVAHHDLHRATPLQTYFRMSELGPLIAHTL